MTLSQFDDMPVPPAEPALASAMQPWHAWLDAAFDRRHALADQPIIPMPRHELLESLLGMSCANDHQRALPTPRKTPNKPFRHRPFLAFAIALATALGARAAAPLPEQLHETGLFAAGQPERLGPGVRPFEPVHALWSDATTKRRWIRLPPGTAINASDPDRWLFPRGTQLWKEFAYGDRVETRYIERGRDGSWRFASYAWSADGRSARLVPSGGQTLVVQGAPAGRYSIPSRADCLACHADARTPVLGVGALQLGNELPHWVRQGLVKHGPTDWRQRAPAASGNSLAERAALGYLHANCGHCHHGQGGVPVPLVLAQKVAGSPAPTTTQAHEALRRMSTREPTQQMPPLGTRIPDPQGLALLRAWLDELQQRSPTTTASTTNTVIDQEIQR